MQLCGILSLFKSTFRKEYRTFFKKYGVLFEKCPRKNFFAPYFFNFSAYFFYIFATSPICLLIKIKSALKIAKEVGEAPF